MGTQPRRRILFVACPYQGHFTPMINLASALHCRGGGGLSVAVICHGEIGYSHPDFHFYPVSCDVLQSLGKEMDIVENIMTVFNGERTAAAFRDEIKRAAEEGSAAGETVAAVVLDSLMFAVVEAVVGLGLPALVLRASNAANANKLVRLSALRARAITSNQDPAGVEPTTPSFPDETEALQPLSELATNILAAIHRSSGIIINTCSALEQPQLTELRRHFPLSLPFFTIGPVHKLAPPSTATSLHPEDRTCLSWLDLHPTNSVLFVSFGSLASIHDDDFLEAAWGLANSAQPFLWVLRRGLVHGETAPRLPQGFEEEVRERGRIVEWAPQVEVLEHRAVGGFLTHSGWNSTVESLCAGVPMICRPIMADQMANARSVSGVWGVGVELEKGAGRVGVEREVRRLMVGEEGVETRRRAGELKARVLASVEEGGDSFGDFGKLVQFLSGC